MLYKCIFGGDVPECMENLQARTQTRRRVTHSIGAPRSSQRIAMAWRCLQAGRRCPVPAGLPCWTAVFVVSVQPYQEHRSRLRYRQGVRRVHFYCCRHPDRAVYLSQIWAGCAQDEAPEKYQTHFKAWIDAGLDPDGVEDLYKEARPCAGRRLSHCLQTVWRLHCLRAVRRPCAGRRRMGRIRPRMHAPTSPRARPRRRLSARAAAAAQVHEAIRADPMPQPKERVKPDEKKRWKTPKLTYDERKAQLKARGDAVVRVIVTVNPNPRHAWGARRA
jgi:hypothetical protein